MEIIDLRNRMRLNRIQSIFKMHEMEKTNREVPRACRCSASTVSDTLNLYRHSDKHIWQGMCSYEKAKYVWDMQKARARAKKRFRGHIYRPQKVLADPRIAGAAGLS